MTSKAQKLLERMKQSRAGWKKQDLDKLYKSFGFIITHGGSHDIVKHPNFPQLRTTLPRHNFIAKVYVDFAIELIEKLHKLQKEENNGEI